MIEIRVWIACCLLSVELKSFMHSRIRGKSSPRYGLIASLLIFDISEMTFRMADTNAEVARSPSSFLIKHLRIAVE